MYADRLGVDRALRLNRFGELAGAGVPLAFGSDAPVTELGPWAAVRAAAYPSTAGAAISSRSAFAAHTQGGWRAAGRGDDGVLAPGAPATFAVWQTNDLRGGLPDMGPAADLPTCLATVHRGEPIHDAGLLS
jgi:predicted amidohydrolase YtcJ